VVLVRELGLLAVYLHRGDRANASRILESVTEQLRKLGVYEDARPTVDELSRCIREGLWDDAFANYQVLVDVVARVDPVISASVPAETYEAYERAARPEQTVSEYAREVLEGRRVPAVASDGVRAGATVAEYLRSIGQEAEHERVIREYLSAIGARRVEGVVPQPTPQPVADWESILAQYRREIEAYMRGERPPGNPGEQPSPQSGSPGNPDKRGALDRVLREVLRELPEVTPCRCW
jgi:hypothetical protein